MIVKVTLNGKPQDATVTVLSEETKKIVTGGRSYPTKPLDVRVIPGRYYFEVSPVGVVGFDKFVVKDVVVKSGDQETLVEKDFEAGTLKIGTKKARN